MPEDLTSFQKWLDERFARLSDQIKVLGEQAAACRNHCDETSGKVKAQLLELEKHDMQHVTTASLQKDLAAERLHYDAVDVHAQAAFWLKVGGIVAAIGIVQGAVLFMLSRGH